MGDFFGQFTVSGGDLLWGIPLWRVLAALVIIFIGFASRKVIHSLFVVIGRRAGSTRIKWDDEAARLLPKPLALVVQIFALAPGGRRAPAPHRTRQHP